jgi:putative transposase
MDENTREKVALFRYGLIAPLLNEQVEAKTYLTEVTVKVHDMPYYGERKIATKTVQHWLLLYRREGFDGLKPRHRGDRGTSRRLTPDQEDHVLALRREIPEMPVTVFYKRLIETGDIRANEASYTTVYRLLKNHRLVGKARGASPERKRFAHEYVNALWQGDTSQGPMIPVGTKKRTAYLIALIDDCSRLVPFAQFFASEKFDGLRTVCKEAMIRRGIPERIYTDNGKVYRSQTLQLACAQLGIILTHTRAYDPASKGKIERFFRTVQTRFYPLLKAEPAKSLGELNARFWRWLENDYHQRPHASLEKKTPLQVYGEQVERVHMVPDPLTLDPIFLKREYRNVKHDATISLHNQLFEVPARFIGQKIELRLDETHVFVYEDGKKVTEIEPVDFKTNAHAKRERPGLSFSEMASEEGTQNV